MFSMGNFLILNACACESRAVQRRKSFDLRIHSMTSSVCICWCEIFSKKKAMRTSDDNQSDDVLLWRESRNWEWLLQSALMKCYKLKFWQCNKLWKFYGVSLPMWSVPYLCIFFSLSLTSASKYSIPVLVEVWTRCEIYLSIYISIEFLCEWQATKAIKYFVYNNRLNPISIDAATMSNNIIVVVFVFITNKVSLHRIHFLWLTKLFAGAMLFYLFMDFLQMMKKKTKYVSIYAWTRVVHCIVAVTSWHGEGKQQNRNDWMKLV